MLLHVQVSGCVILQQALVKKAIYEHFNGPKLHISFFFLHCMHPWQLHNLDITKKFHSIQALCFYESHFLVKPAGKYVNKVKEKKYENYKITRPFGKFDLQIKFCYHFLIKKNA